MTISLSQPDLTTSSPTKKLTMPTQTHWWLLCPRHKTTKHSMGQQKTYRWVSGTCKRVGVLYKLPPIVTCDFHRTIRSCISKVSSSFFITMTLTQSMPFCVVIFNMTFIIINNCSFLSIEKVEVTHRAVRIKKSYYINQCPLQKIVIHDSTHIHRLKITWIYSKLIRVHKDNNTWFVKFVDRKCLLSSRI